jgi:hypothetical protein
LRKPRIARTLAKELWFKKAETLGEIKMSNRAMQTGAAAKRRPATPQESFCWLTCLEGIPIAKKQKRPRMSSAVSFHDKLR